jgi:hypothetical protein
MVCGFENAALLLLTSFCRLKMLGLVHQRKIDCMVLGNVPASQIF